jgi:pectin methylesterase-like acyl-CoA thioesterase
MTTFGDMLFHLGGAPVSPGIPLNVGRYLFVNSTSGSDGNRGDSMTRPLDTIQKAVDLATRGTTIIVAPGAYPETVTISRTSAHSNLTIVGMGGRGAAYIDPSVEDTNGMVCHADDVTLINLGVAGEDTTSAVALTVTGSRFRAYGCKIEGGADQVVIGPGTVAQEAAGTHGVGADALFYDCEICWGTDGVVLTCTDYGGVTQTRFERCRFHNLTAKHLTEAVGSGGAAAVTYFNLTVVDCDFDDLEAGTAPTNYIDLNGDNANTGVVTRCSFPTAINSGLNLVSTATHWVSNYHTGGVSTGQPS